VFLVFETFVGYGEEQMHGIRAPVCTLQIKEKAPIQKGKKGRNPTRGPKAPIHKGKKGRNPKRGPKAPIQKGKKGRITKRGDDALKQKGEKCTCPDPNPKPRS